MKKKHTLTKLPFTTLQRATCNKIYKSYPINDAGEAILPHVCQGKKGTKQIKELYTEQP